MKYLILITYLLLLLLLLLKIPNVSNFVKKSDYNTKTGEIKNKITTNHDYDKYIIT